MDPQTINMSLVLVVGSSASLVVITYFSPTALRRLSAWAESRAAAIDYQAKFQRKSLQRLGIYDTQPAAKVTRMPKVGAKIKLYTWLHGKIESSTAMDTK